MKGEQGLRSQIWRDGSVLVNRIPSLATRYLSLSKVQTTNYRKSLCSTRPSVEILGRIA